MITPLTGTLLAEAFLNSAACLSQVYDDDVFLLYYMKKRIQC